MRDLNRYQPLPAWSFRRPTFDAFEFYTVLKNLVPYLPGSSLATVRNARRGTWTKNILALVQHVDTFFPFHSQVGQFSVRIGVLIKATERRKLAFFGCREIVLETFNVLASRDSGICACAWNGFLFVSSFTDTVLLNCLNRITFHVLIYVIIVARKQWKVLG